MGTNDKPKRRGKQGASARQIRVGSGDCAPLPYTESI